jgi:hypothetical protein
MVTEPLGSQRRMKKLKKSHPDQKNPQNFSRLERRERNFRTRFGTSFEKLGIGIRAPSAFPLIEMRKMECENRSARAVGMNNSFIAAVAALFFSPPSCAPAIFFSFYISRPLHSATTKQWLAPWKCFAHLCCVEMICM